MVSIVPEFPPKLLGWNLPEEGGPPHSTHIPAYPIIQHGGRGIRFGEHDMVGVIMPQPAKLVPAKTEREGAYHSIMAGDQVESQEEQKICVQKCQGFHPPARVKIPVRPEIRSKFQKSLRFPGEGRQTLAIRTH